jgi:predicted RNase H-like HicB family nuclease
MTVQELDRPQTQVGAPSPPKSPVPKPVITFFAMLRRLFGRPEDERDCVYEAPTQSHIGTWNLRVSVTPDEIDGGFIAECLDVPGAMSQGETAAEALENLIDAVQGVVAAKMEENFRAIDTGAQPGVTRFTVSL